MSNSFKSYMGFDQIPIPITRNIYFIIEIKVIIFESNLYLKFEKLIKQKKVVVVKFLNRDRRLSRTKRYWFQF